MLTRMRHWRLATWVVLAVVVACAAITYVFFRDPGPHNIGDVPAFLWRLALWFFGSVIGAALLMLAWFWHRRDAGNPPRDPRSN